MGVHCSMIMNKQPGMKTGHSQKAGGARITKIQKLGLALSIYVSHTYGTEYNFLLEITESALEFCISCQFELVTIRHFD